MGGTWLRRGLLGGLLPAARLSPSVGLAAGGNSMRGAWPAAGGARSEMGGGARRERERRTAPMSPAAFAWFVGHATAC